MNYFLQFRGKQNEEKCLNNSKLICVSSYVTLEFPEHNIIFSLIIIIGVRYEFRYSARFFYSFGHLDVMFTEGGRHASEEKLIFLEETHGAADFHEHYVMVGAVVVGVGEKFLGLTLHSRLLRAQR